MPRLRDEASPVRMSPAISTSPEEDLAQNRSLGEKPGWVGGLVLSNLLFEVSQQAFGRRRFAETASCLSKRAALRRCQQQ